MLAGLRNDDIPVAYKERHTKTVKKDLFKPKPVFDRWKQDDPESLKRAFDNDMKHVNVKDITRNDAIEANALLRVAGSRFGELKEIFHYMQSLSRVYPRVDVNTLRTLFIEKLNIDVRAVSLNKIEIVILQIYTTDQRKQRDDKKENNEI